MTNWAEALDQFEEQLRVYRAVLDKGEEPEVITWPPDDLEDGIPPELVARAEKLLAEAVELEAELAEARAAIPHPTNHPRRGRSFQSRPTISAEL